MVLIIFITQNKNVREKTTVAISQTNKLGGIFLNGNVHVNMITR